MDMSDCSPSDMADLTEALDRLLGKTPIRSTNAAAARTPASWTSTANFHKGSVAAGALACGLRARRGEALAGDLDSSFKT
jgi:hypothetical protein